MGDLSNKQLKNKLKVLRRFATDESKTSQVQLQHPLLLEYLRGNVGNGAKMAFGSSSLLTGPPRQAHGALGLQPVGSSPSAQTERLLPLLQALKSIKTPMYGF